MAERTLARMVDRQVYVLIAGDGGISCSPERRALYCRVTHLLSACEDAASQATRYEGALSLAVWMRVRNVTRTTWPAHVAEWTEHSAAMCSRAWRVQWPWFAPRPRVRPPTKELFLIIPMHMMNRELIPGR